MPWTKDKPPSVAKNWTDSEKLKCVSAANAVIADGGTDEDAIFACIKAAGKSEQMGIELTPQLAKLAEDAAKVAGDMTADEVFESLISSIGASMPKTIEKNSQFLFIELALEQSDKPFDGVAPGDFVDMWGRDVEIKSEDFGKYLENTLEAIKFTTTDEGEIVGLTIDAAGHFDDEAAGWIVDAQLVDVDKPDGKKIPVIQFFAKWTEQGRELLEKGTRRMFSPTLNTKKKVVLGGSLTNWPATRDDMGNVLLRPISLSEGGTPIELEREAIPVEGTDLYAASLVAAKEEDAYEEDDVAIDDDPVYEDPKTNLEGANNMPEKFEFTKEELDAHVAKEAAEQAKALVAELSGQTEEGADAPNLLEMFQLEGLESDTVEQMKELFASEYDRLREQARGEYIAQLALINHEREMTILSTSLTMGSETHPRGLQIQTDQLTQALLDLPKDQVPFWRDLLLGIVEKGLVEFKELGNSNEVEGNLELPQQYAEALREEKLELKDLTNPMLGLGDLAQYDLSEFKKE